jgi:hypothetical protein
MGGTPYSVYDLNMDSIDIVQVFDPEKNYGKYTIA